MQLRGPYDDVAPARALPTDRAGLVSSLMFLGVGYVLILASPLLSSQLAVVLREKPDLTPAGPWLPAAAAAGVALLGASAMMLVLARLVRDVEERPYASIAPVLTVFTGFILMGLRAKLPFAGLASEHLGVFALALSLCGGALASRDAITVRLLGWLLALLPPAALLFTIAALTEQDALTALRRADPQVRVYLILLALSSLALALVGTVSRAFGRDPRNVQTQPSLRVAPEAFQGGYGGHSAYAGQQAYGAEYGVPGARGHAQQSMLMYSPDDDSLSLPRSGSWLRVLALGLFAAAAVSLGTYQFVLRPRQQQAAEAARAADSSARVEAARHKATQAAAAVEAEAAKVRLEEAMAPSARAQAAAPTVTPAADSQPARKADEKDAPTAVASQDEAAVALVPAAAPAAAPATTLQPKAEPSAAKARAPERAPARVAAKVAPRKLQKPAKPPAVATPLAVASKASAAPQKPATANDTPVAARSEPTPAAAKVAAKAAAKPEKAAPERPTSSNSADLDLDQLVEKAMKSSRGKSSVDAANDPLIGL